MFSFFSKSLTYESSCYRGYRAYKEGNYQAEATCGRSKKGMTTSGVMGKASAGS